MNTLPMERPSCRVPGHGKMELRPLTHQTYEQRWCGVWYECQARGCYNSALFESKELLAQLAEQAAARARAGR